MDRELDVRRIQPMDRIDTVLGAYRALPPGSTLHMKFDHDPCCMYYTLRAIEPEGSFGFERLEDGPYLWCVDVHKYR